MRAIAVASAPVLTSVVLAQTISVPRVWDDEGLRDWATQLVEV